jgi:DNA-binding response OmpR family regulator
MTHSLALQQACSCVPIAQLKSAIKMSIKRILFIGSDPAVTAGFGPMLGDQPLAVDWTASGAGGLALLVARHFHLTVLNRCLPDMDGCELCARIRRMNDRLPLLMLAPAGREDMIQGFAAGADDYLPLPADGRELLARVRALIKRALPERIHNTLRTGDIVLDNDSKQVTRGGRPVHVTASEFLLLEYLMKNKNRIVTREELVTGAWKERQSNKPGNLPAHINNLRRKLRDDQYPGFLYTVSRKGYLLAEQKADK